MPSYVSYEDAPVRCHHSQRDGCPRRGDRGSEYIHEEAYIQRGGANGASQMDLIRRSDDSVDSIEEVQRDIPPGDGGYVRKNVAREEVDGLVPPSAIAITRMTTTVVAVD